MIIAVIIRDIDDNLLDTFDSGECKDMFLFDIIRNIKSKMVFYAIVMIVVKIFIKTYVLLLIVCYIEMKLYVI